MTRTLKVVIIVVFALFLLLLIAYFAPMLFAEAKVLEQGTLIVAPDGSTTTLDAAEFLLSRADMEQATYAMQAQEVDAKTILDLRALSNKQSADAQARGTVELIGAVVIAVVAALLGHALK